MRFEGAWCSLAVCRRNFFKIPLRLSSRTAVKGGTGVPPVKVTGVERSPMSHPALRHKRQGRPFPSLRRRATAVGVLNCKNYNLHSEDKMVF